MSDEQISIPVQLQKTAKGFEVLAITAGIGNGWLFQPKVLQESAPLWDTAQVFADHAQSGHSVRDLGGILSAPHWDETQQGVAAILTPKGPAAQVIRDLAEVAFDHPDLPLGLSADIHMQVDGKTVTRIVKIHSLDAVTNPARGGKFIRAIQSKLGEEPMPDQDIITPEALQKAEEELARLQAEEKAAQKTETERTTLQKLQATTEAAERIRAQMCANLLLSTLSAARLPVPITERIRADFKDKTFEAADLTARIDADRELLSALTGPNAVQGPRISGMFTAEDQIRAACQDLFAVERDADILKVQAHRLTGIRELYHLLTGDFDLHGGIFPERAQFQMTTVNFPVLVKNAMNKVLVAAWADFGRAGYNWWEQIATIQHFNTLNEITWSMFGTVGSLPTVAEGAEYTPLKIGDGGETSSFVKKGGYFGITLEAIDRDDTRSIKAAPRELAFAAIREISALVAALFTSASGAGPTLADTGALFNATAVTTAGGHANLLTTALGTDYTAWEAVASAMYNQPMLVAGETGYYGTGKKMAVDPKYILVPRALRGAANNLFLSRDVPGASFALTGGKEWYGMVIPVTVPDFTDPTDWAAAADPKIMPGVMIGERFGIMPEIFIAGNETDPAVFMNDESRIKVRHFSAVGVADFRPLHKSNCA
jgi:hypothetical protein